jgi:DNA-binding transcriptional LysR family regulator
VELRHLRYFVAVAEELHFRRAADRLHVAQPAVSEQVRKLEAELGVQLFHRTQRSVSLTPAGSAMLDEARRVLRQADVACQAARGASERATLRLRLGYLPDSLPAQVSRALCDVAGSSVQNVHVDLYTGPALRLVEDLRAGRLDAVVTTLPAPTNGLRVTPLGAQRAVVALPATHPLAVEPEIALERLAPERIVVLPRDANPALRNAVAAMCHDAGLAPAFVEIAEPRVEHALLAVSAGAGPAILPEAVTERYAGPGVRFVPLASAQPAFRTAMLTDRDTSSIVVGALLTALARRTRSDVEAPRRALALAA